jgi:hypothetical protein
MAAVRSEAANWHWLYPVSAMGTDATVTFQNSLPKSGQWNFVSWQQPVVTEYSVTKAEFAYLGKLTLN